MTLAAVVSPVSRLFSKSITCVLRLALGFGPGEAIPDPKGRAQSSRGGKAVRATKPKSWFRSFVFCVMCFSLWLQSPALLNLRSSAVNEQFDTRDETGVIRSQKQRHLSNFLGFPYASHRDGGRNPRNNVCRLPPRGRR